MTLTLEAFRASRTEANPAEIAETYGEGATGFAYANGLNHIANIDHAEGRFWLLLGNVETVSNDLEALEAELYRDHYLPNCGQLPTFQFDLEVGKDREGNEQFDLAVLDGFGAICDSAVFYTRESAHDWLAERYPDATQI
jgi:hypothetical protein